MFLLGAGTALANNHRTIINTTTAKEMHARGVLFVDVRSKLSFGTGHIPGAVNIDVRSDDFVDRFIAAADKDDEIVIYCRGISCDRSAEAIHIVHPLGYENLFYFKDGMPGWEQAGYPVSK
jgi:rhodanese-related sulfurtransferase